MAEFEQAYALVAEFEGGYSNDPQDRGGETYAGIARNFFGSWPGWPIVDRAKQTVGRSASALTKHLTGNQELKRYVLDWYKKEWWDKLGLERFPQAVSNEIYEQAINLGKGGAGKLLQKMCNAYNYDKKTKGRLFQDLVVDGAIGPRTLDALSKILSGRASAETVVHALNCLQGYHYITLAAGKESQRVFTDGWMKRTK